VHNRWIETEWDNTVEPFVGSGEAAPEPESRQTLVVEVDGRRLEVSVPGTLGFAGAQQPAKKARKAGSTSGAKVSGDAVAAPMQGTIVKVEVGDLIVVLEAMKMENPVTAHKAGTVSGLTAAVGEVLPSGTVVCTIAD
jgi:acetyl-CoA/propionyl-CoA carboxylase biotin carboxyl carrier protein